MHATTGTTGEVNQSTAQVPMKTGLRLFGDAGNQAVKSEMGQLHKRTVMKPKYSKDLTTEQRREALAYLMFLKQKRCCTIKARGCCQQPPHSHVKSSGHRHAIQLYIFFH